MSTWSVSRPVTVSPSARGRGAAHRRHRLRGALAGGVSLVLVASLLAFVPGLARRDVAEAAIVPPGGLVSSADNFGSSQGSFAVTDDGAATYNLPLWAPQGRG